MSDLSSLPPEIITKILKLIRKVNSKGEYELFSKEYLLLRKNICGLMMLENIHDLKLDTHTQLERWLDTVNESTNNEELKFPRYREYLSQISTLVINTCFASKEKDIEKFAKSVETFIAGCIYLKNISISFPCKLGYNELSWKADLILDGLPTNLRSIELSDIGNRGIKCLVDYMKQNTALAELTIKHTHISEEGAKYFAESLKENNSLTNLDLKLNFFGDKVMKHLADFIKLNTNLKCLNLENNNITHEGVGYLAESLKQIQTLTHLYLGSNGINKEGFIPLSDYLKTNNTLVHLDLSRNEIREDECKTLAEILKQNTTLTHLNLKHNSYYEGAIAAFNEAIKENVTLIKLEYDDPGYRNSQDYRTFMELMRARDPSAPKLPPVSDSRYGRQGRFY